MFSARPEDDVIEVTLIGPGYGECLVVHLGCGNWIIVDSCLDSQSGEPAALEYLTSIGVNPATSVRLVTATHWHDDHIRGLSKVLKASENAKFCCATAMCADEFIATVSDYELRNQLAGRSGVREIYDVHAILADRHLHGTICWAISNRNVLAVPEVAKHYGSPAEVFTLSPSDRQVEKFFDELTRLMPKEYQPKRIVVPQQPNYLSVVMWVRVGPVSLLFGADLEETQDDETGWSVIVQSEERPQGGASTFKVPHHGSQNAHNDEVWSSVLLPNAYSILCPYNRGRKKLPSPEDVSRITDLTNNSYSTSTLEPRVSRKHRPTAVSKTIRETVGKLTEADGTTGAITLRNGGANAPDHWEVSLSPPACRLEELHSVSA